MACEELNSPVRQPSVGCSALSGPLSGYDAVVVGAGPAGLAAAYALSRAGLRVAVFEAAPRPALKPCGWGLPETPGVPVPIPRESVMLTIRALELSVDGKRAVEVRGWLQGYIVDKPRFIEALASEAGADIIYRAHYIPGRASARIPGGGIVSLRGRPALLAGGVAFYRGETILAVEGLYRLPEGCLREDTLYIDFDTRLVGYYWAFPRGGGLYQLGVGGYTGYEELVKLLEKWRSTRLPCPSSPRDSRPRGARLAVGGLNLRLVDGLPMVGEAAGFVLPLTGEGIRPSLMSGHAAGEALARGRDPLRAQYSLPIARAIEVQRRILSRVKAMEPSMRGELLRSIPPRVHAEVALGTLRKAIILRELASRPRLAARLLRLL